MTFFEVIYELFNLCLALLPWIFHEILLLLFLVLLQKQNLNFLKPGYIVIRLGFLRAKLICMNQRGSINTILLLTRFQWGSVAIGCVELGVRCRVLSTWQEQGLWFFHLLKTILQRLVLKVICRFLQIELLYLLIQLYNLPSSTLQPTI